MIEHEKIWCHSLNFDNVIAQPSKLEQFLDFFL